MASIQATAHGIVVACPACGQKNRLAFARLEKPARCGACRTSIGPPTGPAEVESEEAFEALLSASSLPVVVDFWAPWCGPCRMVAPELEKVAEAEAGTIVIVKVNTEAIPSLSDRYVIRSIPTMAVFSRGREVARTTGARPAGEISSFIDGALGTRP